MRIIVIVQARMGSSRLPGKVLLRLAGKPVIQHVIERAQMIRGISQVVLATSESDSDMQLVEFCKEKVIPVFRGSENDVLDRYYQAAEYYKAEAVVRFTGDCPLLDPTESSKVVEKFRSADADYASNTKPPMLPDGLDTEIMSMQALEKAWKNAAKRSEREHVTLYLRNNADIFKLSGLKYTDDLSQYRWTIDEEKDYEALTSIFNELTKRRQFGYLHEVMDILNDNPDIVEINSDIQRDEGLARSLKEESGNL